MVDVVEKLTPLEYTEDLDHIGGLLAADVCVFCGACAVEDNGLMRNK